MGRYSQKGSRWVQKIGELIRQRRRQLGLTQAGLAQKAGTSQPCVAFVEQGQREPTLTVLRHLSEALDMQVAIVFVPNSPPNEQTDDTVWRCIITGEAEETCQEEQNLVVRENGRGRPKKPTVK